MRKGATAAISSGLIYRVFTYALLRPRLLRAYCSLLRLWGAIRKSSTRAASYRAVAAVLKRPAAFSNSAHMPNLVAGEFLIGMDPGYMHDGDRRLVERVLPAPERAGGAAAVESRSRLRAVGAIAADGATSQPGTGRTPAPAASAAGTFDLIDDYLVWVVWRALGRVFFGQADTIAGAGDPAAADEGARRLFLELRYLGAHLLVGAVAPAHLQARAQASACALNGRVDCSILGIERSWQPKVAPDRPSVKRNAVGIHWVAHPATVQAGALALQELLGRPRVLRLLAGTAQQLGGQAWTDEPFRQQLRLHVLELLRFRPVFPILTRQVPRDTLFEPAAGCFVQAKAGAGFSVFMIGAMFDRAAIAEPHLYLPERTLADPEDRYLHFGLGDRACPAKHHVVEILVSALAGLLQLPGLRYADRGHRRIGYDGPVITRMRLGFGR